MLHKFALPVTHEFGCYFHVTDLDFYYAVVSYYSDNVTDRYNHHIRLGDRVFKFWSKQGGLYNPKTRKLAFEYMLQWTDKEGASKCTYTIKPLFGKGTRTKTGKLLNLPSVGVNIHIQSSYIDLDEHFQIIWEFMRYIDADRFHYCIDRSKSTIYQMARHIRYHEKHEHDMVTMLQAIEKESSMLGDSKLVKTLRSGKYDMYKLDNPNFSVCNIKTEFHHSVKSYRITNFLDRRPEDPLRHPKLEVFLKSDSDQNPSINQYLNLKKDLDNLLIKLINFIGPIEYVSDSYFDAEKIFEYRYDLPEWDYKTTSTEVQHIDLGENMQAIKALAFIALQSEGCADFRDIQEGTEIPERSLWRYINHWKAEGILDTVRHQCTQVFFKTRSLWEAARKPLADLCSVLKIGFKKIFGQYFVDSGIIRPFRERNKNLKPINSTKPTRQHQYPTEPPLIVETYREANSLSKELKELGISHKIAVISNYNTMRYSRVI